MDVEAPRRSALAQFKQWTVRGRGLYEYAVSPHDLARSLSHYGSADRLRIAVDKMKRGETTKVVMIGGSITAGQGAIDAPAWVDRMKEWLVDNYGKHVTVNNGAVPGTVSAYMSACHNIHVPKSADIIFVEYSANDMQQGVSELFESKMRRSFERLLRKLLLYPNRPAVVLVHSYIWKHEFPKAGLFFNNAERELQEYALYYNLPTVSLKAAAYHHMAAGDKGYQIDQPRITDMAALKGISFYLDSFHPEGNTGARVLAECVMNLVNHTDADVTQRPVTQEERTAAAAPLPRPVVPGNFESTSDKCFIGNSFVTTVVDKSEDWQWINEAPDSPRPKWGYISTRVGGHLDIKVDTTSRNSDSKAGKALGTKQTDRILLELAYLKSYEHMGMANVSCISGCQCSADTLDGHHTTRTTQLHLFNLHVSQHPDCTIRVTVLADTHSGEHKVKLGGVIVSEEPDGGGVRNYEAVDYVHDISARGEDNVTFDLKNHV